LSRYYIGISYLRKVPSNWFEVIQKIRSSKKDIYILQLINLSSFYSLRQLLFSVYNVLSSFEYGFSRLKNPSNELLLVVSGEDQFSRAVERCGVEVGSKAILVLVTKDLKSFYETISDLSQRFGGLLYITPPYLDKSMSKAEKQAIENGALIYL